MSAKYPEKRTRRIVNKHEVKEYNVVFDKTIVLGKGEDTILYGFYWIPSTNETVVHKSITPVPDSLLYTLIHPSSNVGQVLSYYKQIEKFLYI